MKKEQISIGDVLKYKDSEQILYIVIGIYKNHIECISPAFKDRCFYDAAKVYIADFEDLESTGRNVKAILQQLLDEVYQ